MTNPPLLLQLLRQPGQAQEFSLAQWDVVVRQARTSNLLASLHALLERHGVLGRIPSAPRHHLEWSWVASERHVEAVRWEVRWIAQALRHLGFPLVLLKGAAYTCADLAPASGRIFSDIDILVPKDQLPAVEAALMLNGWVTTHLDAYDQRYYRQWMHELPPMRHLTRQTAIDVHHAILPETASTRPCPSKLREAIVRVPGSDELWMLGPMDMVLHSAVHLFHEGEFDNALRDLLDIHLLLMSLREQPGFWEGLIDRARELESERSLYYALRYCRKLLRTDIPEEIMREIDRARPAVLPSAWMDRLWMDAIVTDHSSCRRQTAGIAKKLLYVRANWLRMPPHLLAPHLLRKAIFPPQVHGVA